jgi:hemolysin-activating ACP:hemolysin acyltransferase
MNNPPTTIGRDAGQAVMAAIHLDAIRVMATEEYGRPLGDKEWAALSQEKKWKKCRNSQHMTHELAAQRATKIFEILLKAPIQLAKDYMAATIILRHKGSKARPS